MLDIDFRAVSLLRSLNILAVIVIYKHAAPTELVSISAVHVRDCGFAFNCAAYL